jgi:hypothetical protein
LLPCRYWTWDWFVSAAMIPESMRIALLNEEEAISSGEWEHARIISTFPRPGPWVQARSSLSLA